MLITRRPRVLEQGMYSAPGDLTMKPRDPKASSPDGAAAQEPEDDRKRPRKRFARRIDCAATPLGAPVVPPDAPPIEEQTKPRGS